MKNGKDEVQEAEQWFTGEALQKVSVIVGLVWQIPGKC